MAQPEEAGATLFAHPVERELALILDELGIAWEYEPHTFVLEQDGDAAVREAFTPDFYLPDLGLYVECTVMRASYTSSKRRKVRKLKARGDVTVEVLFGPDIARLAERWSLDGLASALANGRVKPEV
jgi:hypothetical protein